MTRRFRFFAVKEDLVNLFRIAESKIELQYCKCGNFESPAGEFVAESMLEYEKLGYCETGSHIGNQFLVCHKDTKVSIRQFKLKTGKTQYAIDQAVNPYSIILDLHGIHQETAIIVSEAGTLHYGNEKAKELFTLFRNSFRRIAETTIAGCIIGKKAYLQKDLLRFVTIDIKSPAEYDLKIT